MENIYIYIYIWRKEEDCLQLAAFSSTFSFFSVHWFCTKKIYDLLMLLPILLAITFLTFLLLSAFYYWRLKHRWKRELLLEHLQGSPSTSHPCSEISTPVTNFLFFSFSILLKHRLYLNRWNGYLLNFYLRSLCVSNGLYIYIYIYIYTCITVSVLL